LKINEAKIYDLGTFYGSGSFMNPKPIGSKKFLALMDTVKNYIQIKITE
jgi:hypothetical protein